ncbi:MAG: hydrogenase 3 maturation endopeptidase HyCI [Candidatus Acetothermia bacterium]|jgi:hydrogenase 3 maturation protease|nr:hydrogenase 3 maturation endopeptidase HyCI [Candidatus Acetothermia bacterium]
MKLLLGVGNDLLGDDGLGPYVANHFAAPGWKAIDCGTAPENFTSLVKRHSPELLVIVDAAELGLPPGEFRRLRPERAETMLISTHTLPISTLISYLEDYCPEIVLIGVQPRQLELGAGLSEQVSRGVGRLLALLRDEAWEQIPCDEEGDWGSPR